MQRLTDNTSYCFIACAGEHEPYGEECNMFNVCYERQMYEELRKYEELEATGRLVKLPLKVGDTVYIVGERFPAEIDEIRITPNGIFFEYVQYDKGYELTEVWDYGSFCIDEIGKNVFLTLEEVEGEWYE